jgi:hypothetical protein
MTEEQKAKLATVIQEMRTNQKEKDKTIAKMLRLVVQVMEPKGQSFWDYKRHAKHAKDKAALPGALRDLITMLERDDA